MQSWLTIWAQKVHNALVLSIPSSFSIHRVASLHIISLIILIFINNQMKMLWIHIIILTTHNSYCAVEAYTFPKERVTLQAVIRVYSRCIVTVQSTMKRPKANIKCTCLKIWLRTLRTSSPPCTLVRGIYLFIYDHSEEHLIYLILTCILYLLYGCT